MSIERIRKAWPHVRVVLIGLHALAVVALTLPTPHSVANRQDWQNPNMQADLQQWTDRLGWLGYDSKEELENDLWRLAQSYLQFRKVIIKPFQIYSKYSGTRQGWRMFANPRVRSAELHIDIHVDGRWIPVYRPESSEYDFWDTKFRHNRFRKLLGRIGNKKHINTYRFLARFLAGRAAHAFPDADHIRCRLYRYPILPPERVRAGDTPKGAYELPMVFKPEDVR